MKSVYYAETEDQVHAIVLVLLVMNPGSDVAYMLLDNGTWEIKLWSNNE